MELLDRIKQNARKHNMRIVLPEGYEERKLRQQILHTGRTGQIILIGDPDEIKAHAAKLGLKEHFKSYRLLILNHMQKRIIILI